MSAVLFSSVVKLLISIGNISRHFKGFIPLTAKKPDKNHGCVQNCIL